MPTHNLRFRPQFSLRLLLLAFTLFAIGFPIWYRWPYEETELHNGGPVGEVITTWQRQWGGGRAKQGLEQWVASGQTVQSIVYRNGLRHGAYESQGTRGQYENDLKEGVWIEGTRTSTWHRGKLDGPMEFKVPAAPPPRRPRAAAAKKSPTQDWRTMRLVFSEGRLTEMDGKPVADSRGKSPVNQLFELQGAGVMNTRTEAELSKQTTIDVIEMPLKDVVLYLSESHNLPIVLDPNLGPKFDLPLTGYYRDIDLCTALLVLTAPNGLACDYRYGCIWITTVEDGSDWHDRTGIAEIKLPQGTALQRVWNEIALSVEAIEMPLTEVLAYLKQPLAIEIDTSQIEEANEKNSPPLVTANLRGLRFCDTLGQLLYRTGCRCRLEGDKLVVLPPLEGQKVSAPKPAAAMPRSRVVPAPWPPAADPFAPGP